MNISYKKGTMLSEVAFSNFPIIAKNCGLDFIIIDNEHGAFDLSSMATMIMNANLIGINVIVRVGDSGRGIITKLADMGVKGFLRPMTNTKEEIEELVAYAKYSPVGKRGISTTRAHTLYQPPRLEEYKKTANEQMGIYAQIETKAGVDNIESILDSQGVEGVFIGPNDLADDLDVKAGSEPIMECIRRVADVAGKIGKPWGIITTDKGLIECAKNNKVDLISYGSELNMLINGCKKIQEVV